MTEDKAMEKCRCDLRTQMDEMMRELRQIRAIVEPKRCNGTDLESLSRLLPALQELGAYYRGRQDQRVNPDLSHLSSPGHQLLMTRFGPLDLLGTIGAGHGYEDLVQHSDEIAIGRLRLRILSLEKLIEVKEKMGFEKDKAVLPILRQTLLEKQKEIKPEN